MEKFSNLQAHNGILQLLNYKITCLLLAYIVIGIQLSWLEQTGLCGSIWNLITEQPSEGNADHLRKYRSSSLTEQR